MKDLLNNFSWITLFILTPIFFLVVLSQNAIPGDLLYPLKRGIEKTILVAAQVNPTTRAAFHTDLTERRFYEAQKLLLAKQDISALPEFVSTVSFAEKQIGLIRDEKALAEFEKKLVASITTYQKELEQVKREIPQEQSSLPTKAPAKTVGEQPTLSPTNIPYPTRTSEQPETTRVQPTIEPPIVAVIPPSVEAEIDDTNKKLEEVKERIKGKQKKRHEREERDKDKEKRRHNDRNRNSIHLPPFGLLTNS